MHEPSAQQVTVHRGFHTATICADCDPPVVAISTDNGFRCPRCKQIETRPVDKPIPGKEISRQVFPEYAIVEEAPAGYNTVGFVWLETGCVGKCPHLYRVHDSHTAYAEVKAALDRGDRSNIFCYHKPLKP